MSPTFTPDRQTFRALVADVAAKAKARLPEAVNGRVESAVKLVLAHDVTFHDDGTVEVGSASDPMKTYTLAGHACDCQDFAYGKAPEGWCSHRIAAGIAKRVQEQLTTLVPVVPDTAQMPQEPTESPEVITAPSSTPDASTALPEAPASVNCHITVAGRQVQLTLRDTDEARLLQRLQTVLAQFPVAQPASQPQGQRSPQQHTAAAMPKRVTDFCPIHNVQMKENEKDGRRWFSHYDEAGGGWCKGKARGRA